MQRLAIPNSTGTAERSVSAEAREASIDRVAQETFLASVPFSQFTNIVPLALLGLCSLYLAEWKMMIAFIFLQAASLFGMYVLTRMLRRSDPRHDARKLWFGYELFAIGSGVIWAAMMLPVIATLGQGMAGMFVCVVIIVSVAITSMVVATQTRIFAAFLLGFMICLIPQTIFFLDVVGPIPLVATIGLAPALVGLTNAARKQTRLLIRTQLEKHDLAEDLKQALSAAEYLSERDSLTGLYNRRAFEETATKIINEEGAAPLSLILVDLDKFKSINDRFGHATGDSVLRQAATLITQNVGLRDVVGRGDGAIARWGGEEFILLLRRCSLDRASEVAEKLRFGLLALRNPEWPEGLVVTGSFGVASWTPETPLHTAIAMADEAMYSAKNAGRNRVCLHPASDRVALLQAG